MGNYGVAVVVLVLLMILEGFGRLEKWSSTPLAFLNFVAASVEAFSAGPGFKWKEMLHAAHALIKLLEIILVKETSISDGNFLLRIFIPAFSVWVSILLLTQKFSDLPGTRHASDETECNANVIVRADHGEANDGFFGLGTVLLITLYLLLYSVLGKSTSKNNVD